MSEKFDFAAYNQNLYAILDIAHAQHVLQIEGIPRFQYGLMRTYLWVAAFLLTAEVGIANHFGMLTYLALDVLQPRDLAALLGWMGAVAVAFFAFCFGIDSMRGRGERHMVMSNPAAWKHLAWKEAHTDYARENFLDRALDEFDAAIGRHREANNTVAMRLKTMSWSLLVSSVLFAWSVLLRIT